MNVDALVATRPAPRAPESRPGRPKGRGGRGRLAGFVALCLACVSVSVAYLVHADRRHPRVSVPVVDQETAASSVEAVQAEPHVVFRTMALGEAGLIALAPFKAPDGSRVLTNLEYLRVHVAAGGGLCLTDKGDLFTPYNVVFLGPDLKPRHKESLAGLISRARVSPDGRYGAPRCSSPAIRMLPRARSPPRQPCTT